MLRLDHSRIVVLDSSPSPQHASLDNLLSSGQSLPAISELRLRKGEGKTKVAFLSFSSGTTGVPKVSTLAVHVISSQWWYRQWLFPITI